MAHPLLMNNQRAAAIPVLLGALTTLAGGIACWIGLRQLQDKPQLSWIIICVSAVTVCLAVCLTVWKFIWWRQPRLAILSDELLVYLREGRAERVPVEVVECFFIGQDPGPIRTLTPSGSRIENVTVIIRLAEKAQAWHDRVVSQNLGKWEQGYITIFGVWCAPLDGEVVKEMNHRLAEIKRKHKRDLVAEGAPIVK